jgi:hypothetical protein
MVRFVTWNKYRVWLWQKTWDALGVNWYIPELDFAALIVMSYYMQRCIAMLCKTYPSFWITLPYILIIAAYFSIMRKKHVRSINEYMNCFIQCSNCFYTDNTTKFKWLQWSSNAEDEHPTNQFLRSLPSFHILKTPAKINCVNVPNINWQSFHFVKIRECVQEKKLFQDFPLSCRSFSFRRKPSTLSPNFGGFLKFQNVFFGSLCIRVTKKTYCVAFLVVVQMYK